MNQSEQQTKKEQFEQEQRKFQSEQQPKDNSEPLKKVMETEILDI